MRQFRAVDVLDIVVVAFLIYSLIKLVRETRAEQLVKGLLIMIIAWALSSQLNLKMIKTLLDNFFQFGIIALLVVFQPGASPCAGAYRPYQNRHQNLHRR